MQETRLIMGMPVTVGINNPAATGDALEPAFAYFNYVDKKFSPFKPDSEVASINAGRLEASDYSTDMRQVIGLATETKELTGGYFDIIREDGRIDPSGLVKGWAIQNAAELLKGEGWDDFFIDAGGDIQVIGSERRIGIRNPFSLGQIIKVVYLCNRGIATSGTYERGKHIYNPNANFKPADEIASLTVIGPNVYEADRFATAAFAMGRQGIAFIESLDGFEGYMIDNDGVATMTSGFEAYTKSAC